MSGRIHISRMPRISRNELSEFARVNLIRCKNAIREGVHRDAGHPLRRELRFAIFYNEKGPRGGRPEPLPVPSLGYEYYECLATLPRNADTAPPSERWGVERFVFEVRVGANDFQRIFHTDGHYLKFSFSIVDT